MTRILLLLALVGTSLSSVTQQKSPAIHWRRWSNDVFAEARRNNKFVLLDLEAVWCHWCHVMAETTYKSPSVVKLIDEKFIAVRVDQDSRPDLANRYEDYGWPATVIFAPDGRELDKERGYLEPKEMTTLLSGLVRNPKPRVESEPKLTFVKDPLLKQSDKDALLKRYVSRYDFEKGSWGKRFKLLDWDGVEYAIVRARQGDTQAEHMARQTLDQQINLLDPAWGGVYQYSVGGDWKEPHFEKIMQMQAENLRCYALGYALWRDPKYLHAAQEIHRFLITFLLSPDGAFYTSQDADLVQGKHSADYFHLNDSERRKRGVPRVDKHIYARENGWAIRALAIFYGVTGDQKYLDEAVRASTWVTQNRTLPKSGFKHGDMATTGLYMGDSLAMAQAFLELYTVTGDRNWLKNAEDATKYLATAFKSPIGYNTAKGRGVFRPQPQNDENVSLARLANSLYHYTGNADYREIALHALRYVFAPQVLDDNFPAGALLADFEMNNDPTHITVVGHKDLPESRELFLAAASYPTSYRRLEWWDVREGKLPNPDVQYPEMKRPAAFICTNKSCSAPIYKAADVHVRADLLNGVKLATMTGK